MSFLLYRLNDLMDRWKTYYDLSSRVILSFNKDQDNNIVLNNTPVFKADGLFVDGAELSIDKIEILFTDASRFIIHIFWPNNGIPYVDSVSFE